jgi:hypothetical protein
MRHVSANHDRFTKSQRHSHTTQCARQNRKAQIQQFKAWSLLPAECHCITQEQNDGSESTHQFSTPVAAIQFPSSILCKRVGRALRWDGERGECAELMARFWRRRQMGSQGLGLSGRWGDAGESASQGDDGELWDELMRSTKPRRFVGLWPRQCRMLGHGQLATSRFQGTHSYYG